MADVAAETGDIDYQSAVMSLWDNMVNKKYYVTGGVGSGETMYNALLGSLDTEGENFYYTNPLVSSHSRDPWHVCPCCVGNIPRTLLMVPTWTYVKGKEGIYVNLFIGSTIKIENIAGTDVEMVQETNYPWSGEVSISVNPAESEEFTLFVRIPNRTTSVLYTSKPEVKGLELRSRIPRSSAAGLASTK